MPFTSSKPRNIGSSFGGSSLGGSRLALLRLGAVCIAAPALLACTLGPRALHVSSAQYNHAIRRTIDEQLLLNLVRLKYRDSPLFIEIGTISAQFQFNAGAGVGRTIRSGLLNDSWTYNGSLGFQDKPTITFSPLRGEDFVQRLMSPFDLDTLMLLYYSGWSIDRFMRLTVQQANQLENAPSAAGPTPDLAPRYADFARMTSILRDLQIEGLVSIGYESEARPVASGLSAEAVAALDVLELADRGYRIEVDPDAPMFHNLVGSEQRPFFRIDPAALGRKDVVELIALLNLDAEQLADAGGRLALGSGVAASSGTFNTLTLTMRSLIGTLFFLSQGIEVPASHVRKGLVTKTRTADGEPFEWSRVTGDLLRVRSSAVLPPRGAAVAVRYRRHWFYIEDDDLTSKSTFALLGQIFSLQSGNAKVVAPVLTIPVGG